MILFLGNIQEDGDPREYWQVFHALGVGPTETCQITFADFIGHDELWIDSHVT